MQQAGTGGRTVKRCALGTALSLSIYTALQLITAFLLLSGGVGEGRLGNCVWICALIAGFVGAYFVRRGTSRPLLAAGVSALVFWGLIQLLGFMATDNYVPQRALQQLLPIVISTLLALFVSDGHAARRRSPRAKKGSRRRRGS